MRLDWKELQGLKVIKPKVFEDERGIFFESFNQNMSITKNPFVQDNQSISKKNVIRGLHFQTNPYAQGKLVRVVSGKVLDVAVDLRKNSNTYGKHTSVEISAANNLLFWIPSGFAHGFLALEENTILLYKCTQVYSRDNEVSLRWNDPSLNINWGIDFPVVSEKDEQAGLFKDYSSPF